MDSSIESTEQLNKLDGFISQYWKLLLIAALAIVVIFCGIGFYKMHQNSVKNAELEAYYPKLATINAGNLAEAMDFAKTNQSIYSVFVDMAIAKYYAENTKQYDLALERLMLAKKNVHEAVLMSIINLRVARLQIQLGQHLPSIDTLNQITDGVLFSVASNLKGDVYYDMKKYSLAKMAYEQAMVAQNKDLPTQNILIKLNQVNTMLAQQVKKDQTN